MTETKEKKRRISAKPHSALTYINLVIKSFSLSYSFASNEIHGKTAQTWLGYFLNLIQILLATSLYWLVFGYFLKVDTENIPFPLFVLTGMIPWVYFSTLVQSAGNSLIENQSLISKIYFPRVILPISKTIPGLIDFFIALTISIILLILWKLPLRVEMFLIPLFLLILIFSGTSLGIWIASISVKNRDSSRLIPYIINFGFFMTPVFYPATIIPKNIDFILYINPAAFAIEGIRWTMFGARIPNPLYFISLIPMSIFLIWGWQNFRRKEKHYADII